MLKVFWTRGVGNLFKVYKLHVLLFILYSALSFVIGFNFIVNKFNLLGLLLVSVEWQLLVRHLIIEEIQGRDNHIGVCLVYTMLVATVH